MRSLLNFLFLLSVILPGSVTVSAQNKSVALNGRSTNRTSTQLPLGESREAATPIANGKARVTLVAGDLWPDEKTGYQMLIGKEQWGGKIPTTGPLPGECGIAPDYYTVFPYTIPQNADASCSSKNIVLNGSVSIEIEAGEWDYCIVNPTPNDRIWVAGSKPGEPDNGRKQKFNFQKGRSYRFEVYTYEKEENGEISIYDYVSIEEELPGNQWVYDNVNQTLSSGNTVLRAYLSNNEISIGNYHPFVPENASINLTLPIMGGYTIKDIYAVAFINQTIKEIRLPQTLQSIGDKAFEGCSNLTAIKLPASLKTIDANAFKGCTSLASFEVEAGNQKFKTIDKVLFDIDGTLLIAYPNQINGGQVHSYTIPDGVTQIGLSAFFGCSPLEKVTLPSSVNSIGGNAFENCTSLTEIVYEGDKEPTIYRDAFKGGPTTRTLTVPNASDGFGTSSNNKWNATSIVYGGVNNFYSFDSATGVLTIKGNLTTITSAAVSKALGRESNKEKDNSLKEVKIEAIGITTIDDYAFTNCASLKTFHLPAGIQSVRARAFTECTSLTSFTVDHGNGNFTSIDGVLFNKSGSVLVAYPCKKGSTYSIPNDVTTIAEYAFYGCRHIENITFNSQLNTIENYAFIYCDGLSRITLPASVSTLKSAAFYHCLHLYEILYLGSTEPTIEAGAFECGNLMRNVYLPNARSGFTQGKWGGAYTKLIYGEMPPLSYQFNQTTGVLTISGNNTTVKGNEINNALGRPSGTTPNKTLKKVVFNTTSVTTIEGNAFVNCVALADFTIPKEVTTIGDEPFTGCKGLGAITVEEGSLHFTSIEGVLFRRPTSSNGYTLIAYPNAKGEEYSVPQAVTTIGWGAFCETDIRSVVLPESIVKLENRAFLLCNLLTSVTYMGTTQPGDLNVDAFSPVPTSNRVLHLPNATGGFNEYQQWWWANTIEYKIGEPEVKKRTKGKAELEIPLDNPTDNYTVELYDTPQKGTPPVKTVTYNSKDPQSKHRIVNDRVQLDVDQLNASAYYATVKTFAGEAARAVGETPKHECEITIEAYSPVVSCLITFNSNGGSSVSSDEAAAGSLVVRPTVPSRPGYNFTGWFNESGCSSLWNFDEDRVTTNKDLYAGWEISTGVENSRQTKLNVWSVNQTIEIDGLDAGKAYVIYTVGGVSVASGHSSGNRISVNVSPGLYIVNNVKVVVK